MTVKESLMKCCNQLDDVKIGRRVLAQDKSEGYLFTGPTASDIEVT